MARLLTTGFETGDPRSEPTTGTALVFQAGTPTLSTTTVRTGTYALRLQGAQQVRAGGMGTTSDAPYYHRAYVCFAAWTQYAGAGGQVLARPSGYQFRVNSSGLAGLYHSSVLIGSTVQLALDTWYRAELLSRINTAAGSDDSGELLLDGVSIASESNVARSAVASGNFDIGSSAADSSLDLFLDDVAVNDATGGVQDTWPGRGAVRISFPKTPDVALGSGWQGPNTAGADITDHWDALNNVPPQGVAHSDVDANANKYVFNLGTTVQSNLDLTMQDYDEVGVPAAATIRLVAAYVNTGSSDTANTTGAIDLLSNPDAGAQTTFVCDANNVVADTFPTGWWTNQSTIVYAPSVVRATDPTLRVGKVTSTSRVMMVDQMGITIEYSDPVPLALTATVSSTGTMVRSTNKAMTATVTATATIVRSIAKALVATVSSTASMVRSTGKNLVATVSSTATFLRSIAMTLTANVTATATIQKSVAKRLTATVTAVASIDRYLAGLLGAVTGRFPGRRSGRIDQDSGGDIDK